jgi:restriction endonuclease S subunit
VPEILTQQPLSFIVRKESLEKRRDVNYYHPKYLSAEESLEECPYDIKELGDKKVTALVTDGHHGSPEYVEEGEVPYLRVVNVGPFEIKLDDLKFITKRQSDRLGKRCLLKDGEVILSIVGTIGAVAVISKNFEGYCFSRDLARIVPQRNINPFYIAAFLDSRFGQSQMERKTTGAVQKGLYLKSVKSIKIPIPPTKIQEKIANSIRTAYKEKREKIELAARLHESINFVVLSELGIKIPEVENPSLYWVEPKDLEKRRDPMFYHPRYLAAAHALAPLNNVRTMNSISKKIVSGSYVRNYVEKGTLYLRITNVKEHGIDLSDAKYVDVEKSKIPEKIRVKSNDILLTRTGTIGIAYAVPERLEGAVISQHLTRIVLKEDADPSYVALFLNTRLARQEMERGCTGGLQKELIHSTVRLLKIPVPSLDIQMKIVEKTQQIENETRRLEIEAAESVLKAKREVEEVIKRAS